MNIVNRVLTLNPNIANGSVECIAGCRVELDAFEIAGLGIPGNPGFRLTCFLEAVDRGPDALSLRIRVGLSTALDLLNADHVFREQLSEDILNEDTGEDDIRAVFTLVNNSTGRSVIRRSPTVHILI